MFRRESQLAVPVSRFLRNRSFVAQMVEVKFFEYRIDLYGYSKSGDISVAIELKLQKWSRAIEQALLYQLCSDIVYIAMPSDAVHRVDVTALKTHGLGLIAVQKHRCREVISPQPSDVVRAHYRDGYVSMAREKGANHAVNHS